MNVEIPEKLYFKIGEVARLAGVETYVLRYWETEFKEINPIKSRTNQRLYRRKDIDTVISIKELLYGQGFTIEGARKKLKETVKPALEADQLPLFHASQGNERLLKELKGNLEELLKTLES